VALNFPSSPTVGQVYTDSVSGFSYEWNGTVWISFSAASSSQIKVIDDISGSFNGVTLSFALTTSGFTLNIANAASLRISLGGVIQSPGIDYSVSGTNIVFTTAPESGLSFSGISLGPAVPVDYANNGNVYTRNTFTATAGQTLFTVTGTYTVGYLDVYQNDVRLTSGVDYTATTGNTFTLTTPANLNDEVESIGYKVSLIVTTQGQLDNLIVSGISTLAGQTNASNINVTGIVTASGFIGNVTGTASTASFATTSFGLSGTPNLNVGIVTATSFVGSGANLTGISSVSFATTSFGLSGTPNLNVGIVTASSLKVGTAVTVDSSGINVSGITTTGSLIAINSIYTGVTTTSINKTLVNREYCTVVSAGVTVTFPASPSAGWEVGVAVGGTFTDTVLARNGSNIMGLAENMTLDREYLSFKFIYTDSTIGWRFF